MQVDLVRIDLVRNDLVAIERKPSGDIQLISTGPSAWVLLFWGEPGPKKPFGNAN